jgi:hypothetical protein
MTIEIATIPVGPEYVSDGKPIHAAKGKQAMDLDPVGDKEWRDRAVGFIAELTKSYPTPEEQLKAALLVSMYMDFGLTDEIDNIIKYYEIKAAKPKRS